MTSFRMTKEMYDWFAASFADGGPLRTDFDKYYLSLLIGLVYDQRQPMDGQSRDFINYWINDYHGVRETVLGMILESELQTRGIQVTERDPVQMTCKRLFTQESSTYLTPDGMGVANSIAHGGFKFMQERWPSDSAPRSQIELMVYIAQLLSQEPCRG
jgi:hypothetical protein